MSKNPTLIFCTDLFIICDYCAKFSREQSNKMNFLLTGIIYEKGTCRYLNVLLDEYIAYNGRGQEQTNDSGHIINLVKCHRE